MPLYKVSVCATKLTAHFCRRFSVYLVLITRKGFETVTEPTVCNGNNEVIFADSDCINHTNTMEISFNSPKDRRTLSFSIYDFTNRKNSVKLTGFDIQLAGMCSVLAGESMCEKRASPFVSRAIPVASMSSFACTP